MNITVSLLIFQKIRSLPYASSDDLLETLYKFEDIRPLITSTISLLFFLVGFKFLYLLIC